jgi:hypothetical protein
MCMLLGVYVAYDVHQPSLHSLSTARISALSSKSDASGSDSGRKPCCRVFTEDPTAAGIVECDSMDDKWCGSRTENGWYHCGSGWLEAGVKDARSCTADAYAEIISLSPSERGALCGSLASLLLGFLDDVASPLNHWNKQHIFSKNIGSKGSVSRSASK